MTFQIVAYPRVPATEQPWAKVKSTHCGRCGMKSKRANCRLYCRYKTSAACKVLHILSLNILTRQPFLPAWKEDGIPLPAQRNRRKNVVDQHPRAEHSQAKEWQDQNRAMAGPVRVRCPTITARDVRELSILRRSISPLVRVVHLSVGHFTQNPSTAPAPRALRPTSKSTHLSTHRPPRPTTKGRPIMTN